tara:strand:+ start:770 stop:1234 length:465 start_codon:yes stop_codon:yes gene_type:complete
MKSQIDIEQTNKEKAADQKNRRGWWFSVTFLMVVIGLILFLTYVRIVDENRDVLVGILGVITGSISSMMAIASGRNPSEVEELKDKLSKSDADRAALIARLRDAQIQLQLKQDYLHDLQSEVINRLSIFASNRPIKNKSPDDVILDPTVEEWLP